MWNSSCRQSFEEGRSLPAGLDQRRLMGGSMLYANGRSEDTTNQVDDTNKNVVKKYKAHMGHMDLVAK